MSKSGTIYKLCCVDTDIEEIYIGGTKNFNRRRSEHKSCCNNENRKEYNQYVYQFIRANGGFNNWRMIQLEVVNYETKRDLEAHERRWIELLKPKLNKQIPTRTKKEWREDNKDKINERMQVYQQNNKEKIKDKTKVYKQNNKEKIKQYHKVYQQNNKEHLAERCKQYRQDNKEKIAERRQLKNLCDCGKTLTNRHIIRHQKTKNHMIWEKQYNYIYS